MSKFYREKQENLEERKTETLFDKNNSHSGIIDGDYVGEFTEVSKYSSIVIMFDYKDPQLEDEIHFRFSDDGVSWVRRKILHTSGGAHTLTVISRYFSIGFFPVNPGSRLDLSVMYKKMPGNQLVSTAIQTLSQSSDVSNMRVVSDVISDVSLGRMRGVIAGHKFGESLVDGITTTSKIVWPYGNNFVFPTTTLPLRIRSGGDAKDGSTNAKKVMLEGLDSNYDLITEELTLLGVLASADTVNSFIRLNRAYVSEVFSYDKTNYADIVIENTSSQVMGVILAATGQTEQVIFTIPRSHKALLKRAHVNVESNKSAHITMWQRGNGSTLTARRLITEFPSLTGQATKVFQSYIVFGEKTDLWAEAYTDTGTATVTVDVDFSLHEEHT